MTNMVSPEAMNAVGNYWENFTDFCTTCGNGVVAGYDATVAGGTIVVQFICDSTTYVIELGARIADYSKDFFAAAESLFDQTPAEIWYILAGSVLVASVVAGTIAALTTAWVHQINAPVVPTLAEVKTGVDRIEARQKLPELAQLVNQLQTVVNGRAGAANPTVNNAFTQYLNTNYHDQFEAVVTAYNTAGADQHNVIDAQYNPLALLALNALNERLVEVNAKITDLTNLANAV